MNNTLVIVLAVLGGLLWLLANVRERFKIPGTLMNYVRYFFVSEKAKDVVGTSDAPEQESPEAVVSKPLTLDDLERELGIEPEHYLCDRVARINEALTLRREKTSKKKGGAL